MIHKNKSVLLITIILLIAGCIVFDTACKKDDLNTDSSFRLTFSSDTIIFDTVFTTIGSVTQKLLVHNTSNKRVQVGSVRLARGISSPFRINIDGTSAFQVNNLEIEANDSAYIFVKVTIDPTNQDNPLIETDSIVFETNGNQQDVKLVAWGQDAHFFNNDTIEGNLTFSGQKPYVIYGNLVVDSLCNLTIDPGAGLYFHNNSGLLVRNGASIQVNGTLEKPVLFRGDRLGTEYSDVPGQWLGIEIEGQSTGNQFTNADIQNGKVGILLDSSEIKNEPRLILYNCIISNMVNYGVLSIQSNLLALNCRITNCGGYTVAIEGGKCEFRHCTLSNFWNYSGRHYPSMLLGNSITHESGNITPSALQHAYFGNCIINGNSENEIELDSVSGTELNFLFDHCLVQTNLGSKYVASFLSCIFNEDAKFIDPWIGRFELDTLSPAKDAGTAVVVTSAPQPINLDLIGYSRMNDLGPDLGAYERQEMK